MPAADYANAVAALFHFYFNSFLLFLFLFLLFFSSFPLKSNQQERRASQAATVDRLHSKKQLVCQEMGPKGFQMNQPVIYLNPSLLTQLTQR